MAIYHLEHSYLNWKVIPRKKNYLYLCSFFNLFFLFLFGLSRIFQVHDMTINFSFAFFYSFFFEWSTPTSKLITSAAGWSYISTLCEELAKIFLPVWFFLHMCRRLWLQYIVQVMRWNGCFLLVCFLAKWPYNDYRFPCMYFRSDWLVVS